MDHSKSIPRDRYLANEFRLPAGLSELVAGRLRQVHERVARAAESQLPGTAAEVAVHYDRSGNASKAYEHALIAAERAIEFYAYSQALDYLHIAERNASSAAELAEVRVKLAEVAEATGRYDEAESLCESALEWFTMQGDRRRTLPLRRMRERVRGILGQPFRSTLGSCLALDEEAQEIGAEREHVALLMMISQTYGRLGERQSAERTALECVHQAERLSDPTLLADSLNRLALSCDYARSNQAEELYRRALSLYQRLGDQRGQARCHNNLGIVYTRTNEWNRARTEFDAALALGRSCGATDLWGLAGLNLGVVLLKGGDFDGAREMFGEAYAVFANARNGEYELYALYNLAHLERERGVYDVAAELYDVSAALAQRLGQSDVEIGATAGAGLSLLRGGKLDSAYAALRGAEERMRPRTDWFQGRELLEALSFGIAAEDGRTADAMRQLAAMLPEVDATDVYSAAWLTAECAELVANRASTEMAAIVRRYATRIAGLGYTELERRFTALIATA
jgi:tetratricopeptide (TPR) repeat protein